MFSNCVNFSVFYAHNLSFDGSVIINFLSEKINICDKNTILKRGDFYCLGLTNGLKTITFRCSSKIVPLKLSDIGYIFNVGKKMFFDHSSPNDNNINSVVLKNSAIEYCGNDALMVVRFLSKVNESIKKYVSISDAYSISGLSLKIFEHFNHFKIPLKMDKKFDDLIRPSYYGGRCEVFGNLKKDELCYHFDFSGMYTNRLLETYPYGGFSINYDVKYITNNGFYFVSVYSDLKLPILPYRCNISGKLLFPNGNFDGLYWGEELLLFIKNNGVIKEIKYGIEFEKSGYIFKDFGIICNNLRKNSKYDYMLWKIIPNSLIGRMGLKYDNEKTIILDDCSYNPRNYSLISDRKINNKWIVRVRIDDDLEKNISNVMYPAIITSKARILWWESAREVEKNGGRILYCDTDSIFASFNKNISPLDKQHGSVYWDSKKKDTILQDACFATSKVYCVSYDNGCFIKIKGVSKKSINDIDINKFKEYFYNNQSYQFTVQNFKKNNLNIQISELYKIIDFSGYNKRIFNNDKTETSSLWL